MELELFVIVLLFGVVIGCWSRVWVELLSEDELFGFVDNWARKYYMVDKGMMYPSNKDGFKFFVYKWLHCSKCNAGITALILYPLLSLLPFASTGLYGQYFILGHLIIIFSAIFTAFYISQKL